MTNEEMQKLWKKCDAACGAVQALCDEAQTYKYDPMLNTDAGRDFWRGCFAALGQMSLARLGLRELKDNN